MALPSGLAAQFGVVSETTYGQAVTVTRFLPLVDEDITDEVERLESEGIVAGAKILRSEQWNPGGVVVSGDVGLELYKQGTGVLFTHMFGSVSSSATGGVGTHTFTPGDLTGDSFTAQVGRPNVQGTVVPWTFAGCKVTEWELAMAAGENVTLGLTILGQTATTATSLAAASYLTGAADPFTFIDGAVSISGSSVCVREITVTGNNGLSDERRCIGQRHIDEPLQNELTVIEGVATIEFTTTAQYERYLQGIETPLVLTLSATAASCTITMNARWDGRAPNVQGKDLLVVEYPYKAVASTTDASAITAVLVNSQTTP